MHIVDFLEAIEIEAQNGDVAAHVDNLGRRSQMLIQSRAVRQIGQGIMKRKMPIARNGCFGRLHVDDVR
ncbi:hypothetical protein D3C87_2151350 [compost metagenome]